MFGPIDPKCIYNIELFKEGLMHRPILYRMYTDDTYFDVTSDDANDLIKFLSRYIRPTTEIMFFREKYKDVLANETTGIQGVINRFGLKYKEHDVQNVRTLTSYKILINGYTVENWNLLTNENYSGFSRRVISRFINKSLKENDDSALKILKTRYGNELDAIEPNQAARILLEHGLPPDTKFSHIDNYHIDGITYHCWRMLHDDNYYPKRSILIKSLEKISGLWHM